MNVSYRPIFIFGLARSGTNLLARMLDRHPAIRIALDPLLPLFRSLRNALVAKSGSVRMRQRFDPASPFQDYYFDIDGALLLDLFVAGEASSCLDIDELSSVRDQVAKRTALESPALGDNMRSLRGANYGALLECSLSIISESRPGATWIGCKEVWVIEFVPLLARMFPDARFYAIERDPRAILASLLSMATRDATQAAHPPSYLRHWRKQITLARRFEKSEELAGRFRSISYERLAAHPQEEAAELCRELEVDYCPAMIELSAQGWMGNSSHDHGGRDVYAHTVDRWRETLPERALHTADLLCGPEMKLTSYRPATDPRAHEVLSYIEEAGKVPGSWRSDSGNLLSDFGGELVRHALLTSDDALPEDLIRSCFLFSDTLKAIRQAR